MFIHRYEILLPLRAFVGFFGEGSGYVLAVVALGEAEDTDSAFGYSMIFANVHGAVGRKLDDGLVQVPAATDLRRIKIYSRWLTK